MASAKQGYPVVSSLLARRAPVAPHAEELIARLDRDLRAAVHEVIRLTPNTVEVVVKAPMAAYAFEPGQFYTRTPTFHEFQGCTRIQFGVRPGRGTSTYTGFGTPSS